MANSTGRDFIINGEALVRVKGNGELAKPESSGLSPGDARTGLWELGLADAGITITPRFYHMDVKADDYGPGVPADVRWMLAEATIRMNLIHYDTDILENCIVESMAGGFGGRMMGAGTSMGGGRPPMSSGCHYISLNILSPVLDQPWRFPTAYLSETPVTRSLGAGATIAECNWRAIPYESPLAWLSGGSLASGGILISGFVYSPQIQEVQSSGACVWDYEEDVP